MLRRAHAFSIGRRGAVVVLLELEGREKRACVRECVLAMRPVCVACVAYS